MIQDSARSVVGVDFATSPKKTWCAVGEVNDAGRLRIHELRGGLTDKDLIAVSEEGHRVIALDVPFGWPDQFVSFVSHHHQGRQPPTVASDDFQLRVTDRIILQRLRKRPLSVSTDKLGVMAHRATNLLRSFTTCDVLPLWSEGNRTVVIEVYPAATLIALEIDPRGYKKEGAHRRRILHELADVHVANAQDVQSCIDNDDALDAVICALTASLYLNDDLIGPPDDDIVRREGWIFAPPGGGTAESEFRDD